MAKILTSDCFDYFFPPITRILDKRPFFPIFHDDNLLQYSFVDIFRIYYEVPFSIKCFKFFRHGFRIYESKVEVISIRTKKNIDKVLFFIDKMHYIVYYVSH